MSGAVVVPSAPLLLAEHAGRTDPAIELRDACRAAVAWLVEDPPDRVRVLTTPPGEADVARGIDEALGLRVARALLRDVGFTGELAVAVDGDPSLPLLVVADGTARRGEKAPGHLDARSHGFDTRLEEALMLADSAALESLDVRLGAELLAGGVPAFQRLGALDLPVEQVDLDYTGDPFGVQYWVVRWQCAS